MKDDSIQSQVNQFVISIGDRIAPTMTSDEVVALLEEAWCAGHIAAMTTIQNDISQKGAENATEPKRE